MSELNINLGNYRSEGITILSGWDRGDLIRNELDIDSKEKDVEAVIVKIPDDIISITTSFFGGLFGNVVRAYGSEEEFRKKFIFDGKEIILEDVEDGIDAALKKTSPIKI